MYDLRKLSALYNDLSTDPLVFVNVFGEPFFRSGDVTYKISPETGDNEVVESLDDDYCTGESLKIEWENSRTGIDPDHFLLPVVPFVLGGEFDVSNLMEMEISKAVAHYKNIRQQIRNFPDGAEVNLDVKS